MVILDKKTFSQLLKNPSEITLEESLSIKKITKQYPFFQTARIMELIGLKKHDYLSFNKALKNCAIYTTNRSVLYDMIEHQENNINSPKTESIKILSSEKTKNSFIDWLNISRPVSKNINESLISNFLKINPKISSNKTKSNENLANDFKLRKKEYMTETLAKVYFEQKKYSEAIKAYEILCLKYPEKISLFADKIKTIKNSFQNK
jgi:hypothetical protein